MNIRTTFILVVALALVAGYFLLAEPSSESTEALEAAPWFYSVSEGDIRHIALETGGFEAAFVQQERGSWFFDEPQGPPVDLARWGGITLLLGGPKSQRLLWEQVEDPGQFGLDDPTLNIKATLTGDRKLDIALGSTTPDGSFHYAMRQGDPRLYLINASWGQVLARLAVDPPYPPWFYRVAPERVKYLSVTQGDANVELTQDFSGEWRFVGEERIPVNLERWQREVFPILGGPSSLRILEDKLEEFARYGLLAPAARIVVELDPPIGIDEPRRKVTLEVGDSLPDGSGYYAKIAGQAYLLFIDAPWYDTITGLATKPPLPAAATG